MDGRSPFRIYVTSNSSATFHTSNTKTKFGVHLANEIKLDGAWEVALTEIISTKLKQDSDSPLFIYTNISAKVLVGDSSAPCLRILEPFKTSQNNCLRYDNPSYERVTKSSIEDIICKLKDEDGAYFPLSDSGPATVLTLHFRPVQT